MLRERSVVMLAGVGVLMLAAAGYSQSGAAPSRVPVVFWVSAPSRPGDTVLVYGAGLAEAKSIRLVRLADEAPGETDAAAVALSGDVQVLKPVQPCEPSVKFVLPDAMKTGIFAAQVETPKGLSAPFLLNRPQVWWCQGEGSVALRPGGRLRAFGRCLGWAQANASRAAVLLKGPKTVTVAARSDCYAASAELPPELPPGDYDVFVHSGFGGKWGWSTPVRMVVAAREAWPGAVFDVKQIGAKGDGAADDTAAVAEALQKARDSGGGMVYFPRGAYKLTATLAIPPRTILRGEREDLVHLFWSSRWSARLDAVILGANQFGLENLSLSFVGANNGIVADVPLRGAALLPKVQPVDPKSGNIFLRHMRMRWLLYSDHLKIAEANQIFTETARDGGYGATGYLLSFGGENIEITDCDLYSSGNVFNLGAAKDAYIARNYLAIGRCGWANFDGCDGVICEDNHFPGADNMVRSGVTFWSRTPMRNAYFARNTLDNVYSQDREGMTTDGASGKYFGPVASTGATSLTVPPGAAWKPDDLAGHTCFVLGGTGQGQWRSIVGNNETTLTVDRPWDVLPQADSTVGVNHTVEHLLIVGNTMSDLGIALQFYGTAMECIVAENRCLRSGGFFSHAARYPGGSKDEKDSQPQFFVQYLDNEIVEGNTPYFIRGYDYGQGNSVIGVQGFPGTGGKLDWKWPMAIGFVIRGNRLDSNAKVLVRAAAGIERPITSGGAPPLVQDVLIERNAVSHSSAGIEVSPRCAGIVIRKNTFQDVDEPLAGEGTAAALVEN